MAEFVNNTTQVIATGENVLFDDTLIKPCNLVTHREGSGIFTFRGGKKFIVGFSANVTGATAGTAVDLGITLNGELLPYTLMESTPAVADDFNNVSVFTEIYAPTCCCSTIAIRNVGETAITVENANLVIFRED